jgi:hypothetical protein
MVVYYRRFRTKHPSCLLGAGSPKSLDCLNVEDKIDSFYRNVGNKLPLNSSYNLRKYPISSVNFYTCVYRIYTHKKCLIRHITLMLYVGLNHTIFGKCKALHATYWQCKGLHVTYWQRKALHDIYWQCKALYTTYWQSNLIGKMPKLF